MSDDVLVRPVRPDDAPELGRIYAPFVTDSAITFETDPPSVESMRERIAAHLDADEHPWLVCERDGAAVVGYAYGGRLRDPPAYRWAVETTVYVDPDEQERGVGRALYEALGFERVGTFEAVGYKNGAWHDVAWYRRNLGDGAEDPEPPTSTSAVRETDEWRTVTEAAAEGVDR